MSRTETANTNYIEWGPVIAGAVIALAISAILIPFGNSIGLSVSTALDGEKAKGMIFGIGLWLLWTQLISSIIGAYFVGKSVNGRVIGSAYESEFRDGTHGLLAWGVATIVTAIALTIAAAMTALAPEQTQNNITVAEDLTRRATVVFGFMIAASSIVSAVASWIVATVAGDHRDNKVDLGNWLSFRGNNGRKKK